MNGISMAPIKSRMHPVGQRTSSATMMTAATMFTGLALALPAMAADISPTSPSDPQVANAKNLPGVKVEATTGNDYRVDRLSSPKFTQPLLDTTQTISVITKELIQQQGATTLTEALRNSPGVGTFYVGENGSTNTGDSISLTLKQLPAPAVLRTAMSPPIASVRSRVMVRPRPVPCLAG